VTATQSSATHTPRRQPAQPVRYSHALLQYIGTTALTVIGAVTGARYRFDSPGATIAVDFRDLPSLQAVPNLRRVNAP
jgi:hypothetical protein